MTPVQERMYTFWAEWFAQPEEEKLKHLRQSGKGGYYPMGSEAPGYEAKADPKEYFHFRLGHYDLDDATARVFHECYQEAVRWVDSRQLGLNVTPDTCVLRIIHYPATADGNVGQAHCDFDLLTVSVPGTVPGLEVWDGGEWVPREDNEVHVGEMLSIYTRNTPDPIAATPHRVRTPPNQERYKAVFFYLPTNDFELKPGYTAGDYLKEALTKAGTINVGAK